MEVAPPKRRPSFDEGGDPRAGSPHGSRQPNVGCAENPRRALDAWNLFVEKVGGTVHVAIGASYEHCYVEDPASDIGKNRIDELAAAGVLNRSAQHVDLVADFRPGGCGRKVMIDGTELMVKDGVWVVKGE